MASSLMGTSGSPGPLWFPSPNLRGLSLGRGLGVGGVRSGAVRGVSPFPFVSRNEPAAGSKAAGDLGAWAEIRVNLRPLWAAPWAQGVSFAMPTPPAFLAFFFFFLLLKVVEIAAFWGPWT